jgi:hypothetical protein
MVAKSPTEIVLGISGKNVFTLVYAPFVIGLKISIVFTYLGRLFMADTDSENRGGITNVNILVIIAAIPRYMIVAANTR